MKKVNSNDMFVAYRKNLDKFKDSIVVAGITASSGNKKHDDSDLSILEIGLVHEYGVPEKGIPRRSFIREPMQNNIKVIAKLIETLHDSVSENSMTAETALNRIGIKAQNIMKESFINNDWKANSDLTVKRKGSSTPLIDKRQLRQSITFEVRKA